MSMVSSALTGSAPAPSPSQNTVASHDRIAIVSRCPTRAAVPVTPVCSSSSPSDAESVHVALSFNS